MQNYNLSVSVIITFLAIFISLIFFFADLIINFDYVLIKKVKHIYKFYLCFLTLSLLFLYYHNDNLLQQIGFLNLFLIREKFL